MRSTLLLILLAGLAGRAAAATVVEGDGRSVVLACDREEAMVRGSGNRVILTGRCRGLRVAGDRNVIELAFAPEGGVQVAGDFNQVFYAPAAPPAVTAIRGYYDEVLPGPAPVQSAGLLLDGTGGRDVQCAGRDVVIRESAARYALHGGCRSLTIEGERVTVTAELAPAARIVVGGVGDVVNYVLVAEGPPPSVSVTAPHARATHLSRSGTTSLLLPTSGAMP